MKIILVSGKARSGKDSFAKEVSAILKSRNQKVLVAHYAGLLKYICKEFFDWNGKKDETGRTLLQKVGTEGFRKKNPEYWVKFIKDIINVFPNEWDYVIIPDCRFKNEIESWKKDGYNIFTVRMERLDYQSQLTEEQQNHQSEVDLDDYDFDMKFCCPDGYENIINCANDFVEVVLDEQ